MLALVFEKKARLDAAMKKTGMGRPELEIHQACPRKAGEKWGIWWIKYCAVSPHHREGVGILISYPIMSSRWHMNEMSLIAL